MGSGYYHQDIVTARQDIGSSRRSQEAFSYSVQASAGTVRGVHQNLNIRGKRRECRDSKEHPRTTPIVVAMDVTSSRGKDALRIYEQVPSMLGSLRVMEIVTDPQIMWAAIGDAYKDDAPVQISQFESDRRIDDQLAQIWMEEGGGGTGEESYELTALYLARCTDLDASKRGEKGVLFFTGDEAPYPSINRQQVKSHLGIEVPDGLTTEEVFREVQRKFDVFLIYPRMGMEDRKSAIDTEIRRRLVEAGGRFKDVAIRASLIWNNRNDLDLHCLTPAGEHIFFASPRASCGGELDVDRNVHGETLKPVENIRWAKGEARPGRYRFWVENFRYHERTQEAVPFKVELDVNGTIESFDGVCKAGALQHSSAVSAFEFTYAPSKTTEKENAFTAYSDEVVLGKWARYIPAERILRVQDAASAVECMLGAMALQRGWSLEQVARSMEERRVSKARHEDVLEALQPFVRSGLYTAVSGAAFD